MHFYPCGWRSLFSTVGLIFASYLFSQAPANTARPRIWANASRDVPVYSPSFRWVLILAYPHRDRGSG